MDWSIETINPEEKIDEEVWEYTIAQAKLYEERIRLIDQLMVQLEESK